MEDFDKYEYILIDKCDDFHYFKTLKDIAKYLNMTDSQVYAIAKWSRLNLNIRQYKTGLFIQRLFNNPVLSAPADTTFLWDFKQRKTYNNLRAKENYNGEYCFYPKNKYLEK